MTRDEVHAAWHAGGCGVALRPRARHVMSLLVEHTGDEGTAWPSVSTLARPVFGTAARKVAGGHRDRIADDLAQLVAAGQITNTGRTRGGGVIVWAMHPCAGRDELPAPWRSGAADADADDGPPPATPTLAAADCPEPATPDVAPLDELDDGQGASPAATPLPHRVWHGMGTGR